MPRLIDNSSPKLNKFSCLDKNSPTDKAIKIGRAAKLISCHPLAFKLALHHKDLGIALEAALQTGLKLPITEAVYAQEQSLMEAGLGDADVSALRRSLPANPNPVQQFKD